MINNVHIKEINQLRSKIESITQVQSDILLNPRNKKEYEKCLSILEEYRNKDIGIRGRLHHNIWTWHIPICNNSVARIIYQQR